MGRLVFDTLGMSKRLQREKGLSVGEADAMAHDLMFGFLATQPDATPDAVAEVIAPLRSDRLNARLAAWRAMEARRKDAARGADRL